MQHNYQDIRTNDLPGGRSGCSPTSSSYSVVRADGSVISWTLPSSSSDKVRRKS